jgi:hypothetical protein
LAWKEEEGLKNRTGRERDKIEEIKRIRIGWGREGEDRIGIWQWEYRREREGLKN